MKKLVFVGIALFGINVLAGDLWAANTRSARKVATNISKAKSRSDSATIRKTKKKSSAKRTVQENEDSEKSEIRKSKRNRLKKNSQENDIKESPQKSIRKKKAERISENDTDVFSKVKLEDNVSYILKNIIGDVSANELRVLNSNMNILIRDLPKKNANKDVKEIVSVMRKANDCFDELLRVRTNLYLELFDQTEGREPLSESVELEDISDGLERVDVQKLNEIISICKKKRLPMRVLRNLKTFAGKVNEAKSVLSEIKHKFSPAILARIEGIPEMTNLSATDTLSNQKLLKLRQAREIVREREANRLEKSDEKINELFEDFSLSVPDQDRDIFEDVDEDFKEEQENSDNSDNQESSGNKNNVLELLKLKKSKISDESEEGRENPQPRGSDYIKDLNEINELEKFYDALKTNVESLDQSKISGWQQNTINKITNDLQSVKKNRSFEQKVSDIGRIIRTYNSLASSKLKTKSGKGLPTVRREKTKLFRGQIYLEVFNDISKKINALISNEKFTNMSIKQDFEKVLSLNKKNKDQFAQSDSGREKRELMQNSAQSYDELVEKVKNLRPQWMHKQGGRVDLNKLGYTLDKVILSIDVESKKSSEK